MERPDYDSPLALKDFLASRGFSMQKKFGQNFLVNGTAREKIVSLIGGAPGDSLWEIGPGIGAMTSHLLDSGYDLTVFEIDHGFAGILDEVYGGHERYSMVRGDVLKTWKPRWRERGAPKFAFGNLPYNVAGGIIADFVQHELKPERMIFTVQKESADRMRAKPETSNYSSFSVLCQSAFSVRSALDLKPGSFWPMPEVTSTVVVMEPRTDFPAPRDRGLFLRLLRAIFATRRKTLRNNIKNAGISPEIALAALEAIGVSPERRAETMAPETIAAFADKVAELSGGQS